MPYETVSTMAVPFLSMPNDVPHVIMFETAFRDGRPRPGSQMEPGKVATVALLARGSEEFEDPASYEAGLGAIAFSEITKKYPGDKVIGKMFRVIKHKKTGGGKANPCTLSEVKAVKK